MLSPDNQLHGHAKFEQKDPFRAADNLKLGKFIRDDRRLDVICSQCRDLWGE